jgi:hypothetical protein
MIKTFIKKMTCQGAIPGRQNGPLNEQEKGMTCLMPCHAESLAAMRYHHASFLTSSSSFFNLIALESSVTEDW